MLPDFFAGYFNQSFRGNQNVNGYDQKFTGLDRFHAVQVGIAVPIFPGGYKAKVNAAKINEQVATSKLEGEQKTLIGELNKLIEMEMEGSVG